MSNGPELPPPGWYPDPENLRGPKRWWDGSDWTDRRRMDGPEPPPPGQFPGAGFAPPNQPAGYSGSYSQADVFPGLDRALSFGGRTLSANWRPLLVVELLTRVIPAVAIQYLLLVALDGLTFNDDGPVTGFDSGRWAVLGVVAGLSILLAVVGASIIIAIVLGFLDEKGEIGSQESPPGRIGRAVRKGFRRTLPVLGWYLVASLAAAVPVFFFFALFAFSPALGTLALLFLAIPLAIFLFVKFGFFLVAAVDGPGNPFSRSMKVSAGRFWSVFGTLVLAALAIFLISFILSIVSGLVSPVTVEPLGADDQVTFKASYSILALGLQGVASLLVGVFTDGFGGGVAALLYRSANPRQTSQVD